MMEHQENTAALDVVDHVDAERDSASYLVSLGVSQKENNLSDVDLGDLPIRDYWSGRRVSRQPFEGKDRRTRECRRSKGAAAAIHTRRSERPAYRFRRSHRVKQLFVMAGDLVSLVAALLVPALTLGLFEVRAVPETHYFQGALPQFILVACLFLTLNWLKGRYSKKSTLGDDLGELFKLVFIAVGVQSVIAGLIGDRAILLGLLLTWGVALVLIPLARLTIKCLMYKAGIWTRPTVIIGAGENAKKAAEAMHSDWLLGFNVVEFINYEGEVKPTKSFLSTIDLDKATQKRVNILGHEIPIRSVSKLDNKLFSALGNPHIVVATDTTDFWDVVRLLYEADVPYSSLNIAPSLGGIPMIGLGMTHVFRHDVLMLTVQNNLAQFIPRLLKRSFDLVVALLMLLALSPFLLVVTGLVRMSGKNVFFGHERIGQQGKTFKCYKFRSMVNNSKEVLEELLRTCPDSRAEWDKDFKLKNDPRVTKLGDFIRKSSIDELPQLWNVLRGDMSLVGPRPVISDELDRYDDKQDLYHMVKPGITGLWQISGRNDVSYDERVNLDSWYSRNWSLWYDILIMCKTVQAVLQRSGAY